MNAFQHPVQSLPENRMVPVFTILALVACILWAVSIGFWSTLPFALIFSFWKRAVTISSMRNSELHADNVEHIRLELRHLNSKIGFITVLQFGVWLLVFILLNKQGDWS